MKSKILMQINATANWGSTGRIAEQINIKAQQCGWECYVVYGRNSNSSESKLIKVGNYFNTCCHYIENRLFDKEGLASRLTTKKLIKQIKNIKPNIIHLHNIHDHWLNYKLLFEFLNSTSINVIWTFHDCWAFTGHCYHFIYKECNKWIKGCNNCPINTSLIDRSYKNYELKKTLFTTNSNIHIVTVSNWLMELTKKSFFKNKNIHLIENGINLSIFKPNNEYVNTYKNKFVILAVSSQWKGGNKGLKDYISLSKILRSDEIIILVGIPEKMKQTLPSNIIGITRTNNQHELAALYSRADVVVSFSSAETFGLTIVEGYACGTPAVVYNNTALPSLITNKTGFLVPDKDYKAAYEAIKKIRIKGKGYFSKACIELAKQKYNQEYCFDKYINLYDDILLNRSRK